MQTAENERATASLSGEATTSLSGVEQVAGQMENMGYEQFLKVKRNKWNKEALINVGCRLKNIATIENIIRKEGKHKEFMSSYFKQFTNFPQNSLFSAMIVHGVLLREITIDDATENDLFISLGASCAIIASTLVLFIASLLSQARRRCPLQQAFYKNFFGGYNGLFIIWVYISLFCIVFLHERGRTALAENSILMDILSKVKEKVNSGSGW
ncbi:hypothetical protein Q3G72_031930 [Acer saccharum]|nr:hypothetical protein Q3G72_031930 [Acer saccharum]